MSDIITPTGNAITSAGRAVGNLSINVLGGVGGILKWILLFLVERITDLNRASMIKCCKRNVKTIFRQTDQVKVPEVLTVSVNRRHKERRIHRRRHQSRKKRDPMKESNQEDKQDRKGSGLRDTLTYVHHTRKRGHPKGRKRCRETNQGFTTRAYVSDGGDYHSDTTLSDTGSSHLLTKQRLSEWTNHVVVIEFAMCRRRKLH